MKKMVLCILLTLIMMVILAPDKVEATGNTSGGGIGEELTWQFEDGVLTISGNGTMRGFYQKEEAPWYHLKEDIHTVVISEGVKNIGSGAFEYYTNLKKVKLPNTLTMIGYYAFRGCSSLVDITLPDSLKDIEGGAFIGCAFKSIKIPDRVVRVGGSDLFAGCTNLESVQLSHSMARLTPGMFRGCTSLKSITLPPVVDCISWHTFAGCTNLKTVTIQGKIDVIQYDAFEECVSLESLDFPAGLTYIGERAFSGCKNIKEIYFRGDMPDIQLYALSIYRDEGEMCNLYYPINNKTWTTEKMENALKYSSPYIQFVPYGTPECEHEIVTVPGKEATCTEGGQTEKQYCSKCNKVFKEHDNIDPLGHEYDITVIAPTCTESGYDLYKCTRCSTEETQNEVEATGHNFGEWETTKEPTEEQPGLQVRSCTLCQEQEEQELEPLPAPSEDITTESITEDEKETTVGQDDKEPSTQEEAWTWKVVVPVVALLIIFAVVFLVIKKK